MSTVAELDLPQFDYTDPTLSGEAYRAAMSKLAGQGWIAAGPLGFLLLDRESSEFFLKAKTAVFPGLKIAELFEISDGPLHEEIVRNIININGPDHGRLRNLLNPALSPRAAARHRPMMRSFLEQLYGELPADGRCDFVEAFAKPYPSLVIAQLMGAPLEDAPKLHHWSNWIQRQFDPPSLVAERARIEEAVLEFYAYADELLPRKRANPGEDLISALIAAEDEEGKLSDVELVNLVLDVMVGGVDTAQSQLSHAVRLLAQHPDQWALLRERPELAGAAVEEALRYEPVTPFTARITVEDVEYRDVSFPAGTVLMVSAWHANRDIDSDGDADRFDIAAERGRAKPLTFGAGIHYCVGANIARAELEEALAFLAEKVERLELDGEPGYGTITGIYGMDSLPVRLTPAA
jgi:cytochrome P450